MDIAIDVAVEGAGIASTEPVAKFLDNARPAGEAEDEREVP